MMSVSTAPRKKKAGKPKSRIRDRESTKEKENRGVILLSHIPRGFYERQMMSFFSQFGEVTRLKLIRSKKTGGSRHFAFIEFLHEDVAKIAAETMNFYLMFRKVLRCKFIPQDKVHKNTFARWREIRSIPNKRRDYIQQYNRSIVNTEKIATRKCNVTKKRAMLQKKLQDLGIDYDVVNIKKNESFIPPRRSRASMEEVVELRSWKTVTAHDGRCPDFEYSDDEESEPSVLIEDIPSSGANLNDSRTTTEDDDGFGVMVIDPDDRDITFKSPPAEVKIKKRTLKSSTCADLKDKRRKMLQKLQQSLDSGSDDA